MDGPADCRRFTAAGRVQPGAVRQVEMMPGFCPFRRDVTFVPVTPVPMENLRNQLRFWTSSPSVGLLLRRGFFQVDPQDALVLAHALGATQALNLRAIPFTPSARSA